MKTTTKRTTCSVCGQPWNDLLCLDCADKATPKGPPLKRLRRFGFKIEYYQRKQMQLAVEICHAIPTEADPENRRIRMSRVFVACNGETCIGHEWIYPGGGSYSWSESYPPAEKS